MSLGRERFLTSPQVQNLPEMISKNDLRFDKPIGDGTYADVFLGAWKGNTVAIKSLKLKNNEFDACNKEREIMQQLTKWSAPHVIQFLGFRCDVDSYYIVMEYAVNGALSNLIQNNQPFDLSLRYEWARQLTEAVFFLHEHNIVHRDIKSFNILIDINMNVKLADFGLATKINSATGVAGTPGWAAPEICNALNNVRQLDLKKADDFSLATALWELVAWKIPYGTITDRMQIIMIVARGNRETIPPTCPPKLAKLITWGWQQKPEDRPTASELLDELSTDVNTISEKVSRLSF